LRFWSFARRRAAASATIRRAFARHLFTGEAGWLPVTADEAQVLAAMKSNPQDPKSPPALQVPAPGTPIPPDPVVSHATIAGIRARFEVPADLGDARLVPRRTGTGGVFGAGRARLSARLLVADLACAATVLGLESETSTAPLQFLILLVAGFLQRRQKEAIDYLLAENRVLRARLGPKRLRFVDSERRVLAERAKRVDRRILEEIAMLASPATLLRWYRELVATKYDGTGKKRRAAAPTGTDDGTVELLTMARENTTWGYTRLRGALKNVGFEWSRSTIARVLKVHGIEPAPRRGRSMSWKTFLKAHWDAIATADFFSVEVLTPTGLVRYFVFFVMELKSRRVHIAGIWHSPDGAWMAQLARNLSDATSGFLKGTGYLIVDRDPLYTEQFRSILASTGTELLRLPPSSPNLNAYAERFVRSIREECLLRIIPLGERHLRHVISEYVEHFHTERNHEGLGDAIPVPTGIPANQTGAIVRRERLGGMLSYYYREAA
jgi:hypothetical protein